MSDESDRRRAYAELAGRGQPVPGKNFGVLPPKGKAVPSTKGPAKFKEPVRVKQLDLFKKKMGGYTVKNRYSDIMLPEKKKTTRIT